MKWRPRRGGGGESQECSSGHVTSELNSNSHVDVSRGQLHVRVWCSERGPGLETLCGSCQDGDIHAHTHTHSYRVSYMWLGT